MTHASAIRAVVFDFGNVVGFFDHRRTLEKLAPLAEWTPKRIYDEIYSGELETAVETGRLSAEEFFAIFRERAGLRCDDAFLRAAIRDIFTPNPEVCGLIPSLAGRVKLILGSNTNAVHAEQFLDQFAEVLSRFDALVLSHEIGARKPDERFYLRCAAEAGCAPAECVFVDDLAINIAAAASLGMRTVHYRPENDLPASLRFHGVTWE